LRLEKLERLFGSGEQWLMQRILEYAKEFGYTKYTSTLEEPWRLSVRGLSDSLLEAARKSDCKLDIHCEEDISQDPAVEFGVLEARKHRSRGIPFEMFLALMNYYERAFLDLCETIEDASEAKACSLVVENYFDRLKIGFSKEWAGLGASAAVAELQARNRDTTDEKVRYLTIFENLNVPVILLDENGLIENINEAAGEAFGMVAISGSAYYSHVDVGVPFAPLDAEITAFLRDTAEAREFERSLQTKAGQRFYIVRLKRMQDVAGTFRGITVALSDVTERKRVEDDVLQGRAEYRALFENMIDAVAQQVAVRDESGAIIDYRFAEVNPAFEELFGLSRDDVVGKLADDIWPPGNPMGMN
jgi:PAS domain-containing protein